MIEKISSDDKYDFNRHGSKGKRVGQAVVDILSKDNASQTVEETLQEIGPDFAKELEKCIEDNLSKYDNPFYVFVLTHKMFWADNVVRNWFIARQSPPHARDMIKEYPHYMKTLYRIDKDKGDVSICWNLPGNEDCNSLLKNPQLYHEDLVKWIMGAYTGEYDKDSYGPQLAVS